MRCSDEIQPEDLPGGLKIETSAVCSGKKCRVGSSGLDHHEVVVTNRSLLTYEVTIAGECETADIKYLGLGANWPAPMLTVPGRPGSGGKTQYGRRQRIVSVTAGEQPTIRTDVSFGASGRPKMSGTMVFQVETT